MKKVRKISYKGQRACAPRLHTKNMHRNGMQCCSANDDAMHTHMFRMIDSAFMAGEPKFLCDELPVWLCDLRVTLARLERGLSMVTFERGEAGDVDTPPSTSFNCRFIAGVALALMFEAARLSEACFLAVTVSSLTMALRRS